MDIARDSELFSQFASSVTSLTFAFNNVAGDVLYVMGHDRSGGASQVSGITYNGVAMTKINELAGGGGQNDRAITLWRLASPAIGSHNVIVSASATVNLYFHAISYSGSDTLNPDNGIDTSTGNNVTSISTDITTTINKCWMLSFSKDNVGLQTYTNTTGDSIRLNTNDAGHCITDTNGQITPAGSNTMTNTMASNVIGMISVAIRPRQTVDTNAVTSIGQTTATGNGEVISDEGATITERGFVWSTITAPTTANNKVTAAGTIGVYSAQLTGLSNSTTYYVRSYYINANGTTYGNEVSFVTLGIGAYDLIRDIGAVDDEEYAVSLNVTGTTGTITIQLGSTGASTVINAGAGISTFQGVYSGTQGVIITRSEFFDGTIDDFLWVRVVGEGTIDWDSVNYVTVSPIASEVFFKRIEDDVFNSFVFYRQLDLLFKDFDGYVTVTLKEEKNDAVTSKTKTFQVGNASNPASPFSKKRISMLCKDQAIIIGLSNASLNETFAIARFVLSGSKRPKRMFASDRIISVGS